MATNAAKTLFRYMGVDPDITRAEDSRQKALAEAEGASTDTAPASNQNTFNKRSPAPDAKSIAARDALIKKRDTDIDTPKMRKGGTVRGCGIAQRGLTKARNK